MKNKETENGKGIDGIAVDPGPFKALTIDWDLYARYLEDSDLSEDQKREFLQTLWSIIVSFVDLGFDLNPVQQACGPNGKRPIPESGNVIESSKHLSQKTLLKAAERMDDVPAGRDDS